MGKSKVLDSTKKMDPIVSEVPGAALPLTGPRNMRTIRYVSSVHAQGRLWNVRSCHRSTTSRVHLSFERSTNSNVQCGGGSKVSLFFVEYILLHIDIYLSCRQTNVEVNTVG